MRVNRPREAFVSSKLFEVGIGKVVIARFRHGEAEVGSFLLDVYCLGVKDAFFACLGELEYDNMFLNKALPPSKRVPIDPPSARKLVEGAAAYASNLGFAPPRDYKMACRVLSGIDASKSTASFTFGKDGKPFYVQGPGESSLDAARIIWQLRTRCGDGNFDYLVLMSKEISRALQEPVPGTTQQRPPIPPSNIV